MQVDGTLGPRRLCRPLISRLWHLGTASGGGTASVFRRNVLRRRILAICARLHHPDGRLAIRYKGI